MYILKYMLRQFFFVPIEKYYLTYYNKGILH